MPEIYTKTGELVVKEGGHERVIKSLHPYNHQIMIITPPEKITAMLREEENRKTPSGWKFE